VISPPASRAHTRIRRVGQVSSVASQSSIVRFTSSSRGSRKRKRHRRGRHKAPLRSVRYLQAGGLGIDAWARCADGVAATGITWVPTTVPAALYATSA
jgi:hypothetical protein